MELVQLLIINQLFAGVLLLVCGKTTLALALSKNSNLFYSDEKILIDLNNKKAIGRIKYQYISNQYWKEKYGNSPYYKHSNLSEDIAYEIGVFVYPIICEQNSYILDFWEQKKFLWHLYEESSRKIRGTSRIFFNNTYPAPSLDTENIALKRLNLLKSFVNDIPSIYFKGPSEICCSLITNNFCNSEKIQNKAKLLHRQTQAYAHAFKINFFLFNKK